MTQQLENAAEPAEPAEPTEPADPASPADPVGRAGPTGRAEPADLPEPALPSFSEQLADQLGGVRGVVESSIPVLVFVVASLVTPLRPAIIAAVGTALAMAGYRLARKESVRHAINGVFGIVIGAVVAWKSGNAAGFYLPGILYSLGYGLAMLVSVAVRRPLVGWIHSLVVGGGSARWRQEPRLVRTFGWLTVLWAGVFLVKVVIQAGIWFAPQLSDAQKATALGVARLALGVPPYALLLALTVWAVRRVSRTLPVPEPD